MAAKPAQDTAPAGAPLTGCDPDFDYRFGVDLFVRGVQALAEQG